MYNNGENPHLNKIGACYCQDVNVDYAPDGQYTTFENGRRKVLKVYTLK